MLNQPIVRDREITIPVSNQISGFTELTSEETVPDKGMLLVQTNADNLNLVALYEQELGKVTMDSLRILVSGLSNTKVAHINATAFGGGVAELLHRQIPLMNQLGESVNFHTDW